MVLKADHIHLTIAFQNGCPWKRAQPMPCPPKGGIGETMLKLAKVRSDLDAMDWSLRECEK
jgi:hypothetical protein